MMPNDIHFFAPQFPHDAFHTGAARSDAGGTEAESPATARPRAYGRQDTDRLSGSCAKRSLERSRGHPGAAGCGSGRPAGYEGRGAEARELHGEKGGGGCTQRSPAPRDPDPAGARGNDPGSLYASLIEMGAPDGWRDDAPTADESLPLHLGPRPLLASDFARPEPPSPADVQAALCLPRLGPPPPPGGRRQMGEPA